MPRQDAPAERRLRGTRAGIDLARIVEAARGLPESELTMQAVADRLGVDRKAVNHHVGDRETLLRMVAVDALSANFSVVEIGEADSWQDACRAHARGFVDAVLATGGLAEHLPLGDPAVTGFLQQAEAVLAKMTGAGFDDETAQRGLALLTNLCLGHARDALLAAQGEDRLRPTTLKSALVGRDPDRYPILARIAAAPADTYGSAQFEFSVDVFLSGLQARR